MAGFKTWADGDILTPADYNAWLASLAAAAAADDDQQADVQCAHIDIVDANTGIGRDGSDNLTLKDAVTGTKTLQQLAGNPPVPWYIGPGGGASVEFQMNALSIHLIPVWLKKSVPLKAIRFAGGYYVGGSVMVGAYDSDGRLLGKSSAGTLVVGDQSLVLLETVMVGPGIIFLGINAASSGKRIIGSAAIPRRDRTVAVGSLTFPDEITIPAPNSLSTATFGDAQPGLWGEIDGGLWS